MPPTPPVFPAGAVRDALGLVRLLWLTEREGVDVDRIKLLTDVGETLAATLKLGQLRPETLGYRAALSRSAEAMDDLARAPWPGELAEVVRRARARVRGEAPQREDARAVRRKAEELRR